MPRPVPSRNVRRIGRVRVATFLNGRGREVHAAMCTRCRFVAEYASRSAAERDARRHRCPVR